jgi:hypothetical protein
MQEVPQNLTRNVAQGVGGFQQANVNMSSIILRLWPFGCACQAVRKGFAVIVSGTDTPIRVRIEGARAS